MLPSAGSLGLYLYSVSLGNVWEPSSEKNKHKESSTSSSAVWKLLLDGGSSVLELLVPLDTGVQCSGPNGVRIYQRVSLLWQAGLLFYTHLFEVEGRASVFLQ